MMLTLSVCNADQLEGGQPKEFVVNKEEAVIGRSPACDWSLPDPDKLISSRHCKISYADGGYVLADLSTNGTYLNGSVERMPAEHKIATGDIIQIGRYQLRASLGDDTKVSAAPHEVTQPPSPAPVETQAAEAPAPEPEPAPPSAPEPAPEPEPAGDEAYKPSEELWQKVNAGNDVDWERGGFGGGATREATVWQPAPAMPAADTAQTAAESELDRLVAAFIAETGLAEKDVEDPSPDVILRAARLIKGLVAGLVVMVEARARAKAQMGAETTNLSLEGNNPIKFTRTPEQALARLLNLPERGFMGGEDAIEDAFVDLQAHQVATLKAMQGALKTALNRFSPDAIRRRAELKGIFSRILPTARDAALWQNYEREFGLVAQESDEAFIEVFAKQFRKAYEQQTQKAKEEKAARGG
jgi:type VI secretion system protein